MAKQNGSGSLADNQLTRLVVGSANQVWHVGRGAYTWAGSGGGRLVGGLMNLGGRLDREAKSRVFEARSSAAVTWERLESAFVQRVARALNALQIPTARDVRELNQRVESLQKAVVALERRAAEAAAVEAAASRAKPAGKAAAAARRRGPARKKTASVARAPRKKAGS
ncbi:phasin family protein [Thioalkalivibrio sp. XN279]|uniref:phasin family protein n=1 Tax=Thioalkalivibrio sp. XN279 TaxID=2714953 RepID=UPI00140D7BB4|nr:phasin family protein [Thioalkalivibrio sp. XN279]NHA13693.1 phasin family protein [Thioalkalivibrio sp. XN279]